MSGVEHTDLSGKQLATPVAASHLVTIALSAAGLGPLRLVLSALPPDFPAAIVILQHIARHSELPQILRASTPLRVKFAEPNEVLRSNTVYVCPPRVHAVITPTRTVALSAAPPIRRARPCADWLFESAAASFQECAVAVILSGRLSDGARGIVWMRRVGAQTIAQAPATCGFSSMPLAAIRTGCVDRVLPPLEIASALGVAIRRENALSQLRAWEEPFAS